MRLEYIDMGACGAMLVTSTSSEIVGVFAKLSPGLACGASGRHRPSSVHHDAYIRPLLQIHCTVACYGLAASCPAHPVPPDSSVVRLRLCSTSTPSPPSKLALHWQTRDLCTDAGLLKRQTAQASAGWLQNRRNSGMSKPSILSGAALCTLAP